ncbi:hypothetical protein GQ457_11G015320 [Hibiscus cannabinus]
MTRFEEGRSISCPPLFEGEAYSQLSNVMKYFIQAQDFELWDIIEEGYIEAPKKKKKQRSENDTKAKLNSRAMHILLCGLNEEVSKKVSTWKRAKEMLEKLERLYGKEEKKDGAPSCANLLSSSKVDGVLALNEPESWATGCLPDLAHRCAWIWSGGLGKPDAPLKTLLSGTCATNGKAVKPKVGQLKCHRCKGPHKLRECPSRATTSKVMNEPKIEKVVEFGSTVSDGLDMSEKVTRKLVEAVCLLNMPSETTSVIRSKEMEPKGDITTEDTPPMGKVSAPEAEERVHVVANNINEDGSVLRVLGFADVEEPTRVNATEEKVHLEHNSCAFEFDLSPVLSVGRNRPNLICESYGHECRSEGKSKSGDVPCDITWRKKSKRAVLMGGQPDPSRALLMGGAVLMGGQPNLSQTSVQAEASRVHQAGVTSNAEDQSITWREEPRRPRDTNKRLDSVRFVLRNYLSHNCLINQQDNEGNTAVHLAVIQGNRDNIFEFLINDSRIDTTVANSAGHTIMDILLLQDHSYNYKKWITLTAASNGGLESLELAINKNGRKTDQAQQPKKKFEAVTDAEVIDVGQGLKYLDSDQLKQIGTTNALVATLVATVSFAAGITMSGGYRSDGPDEGMPILGGMSAFRVYVMANVVAFALSALSIGSISTVRIWKTFLVLFCTQTLSDIIAMVISFIPGIYTSLSHTSGLANAVVVIVCCAVFVFISVVFKY